MLDMLLRTVSVFDAADKWDASVLQIIQKKKKKNICQRATLNFWLMPLCVLEWWFSTASLSAAGELVWGEVTIDRVRQTPGSVKLSGGSWISPPSVTAQRASSHCLSAFLGQNNHSTAAVHRRTADSVHRRHISIQSQVWGSMLYATCWVHQSWVLMWIRICPIKKEVENWQIQSKCPFVKLHYGCVFV